MKNPQPEFSHEELGTFEVFKKIIERLRGPDGCPWDKKQTHDSLKQYLLEESYEVLETIDEKDMAGLSEEMGDLWLQIMLHSQIAAENGEFKLEDVLRKINSKLIYRHPHVFGGEDVKDAEEVSLNWVELKGKEKPENNSILSGVPKSMPALAASQSLQRRAASVGFDWDKLDDVMEKLVEEVNELRQAGNKEEQENEFGDILFTLANIARRMDIELESALRQTNAKFTRRFNFIEESCRAKGIDLKSLTLAEMDSLWNEAKGKAG
jgi:tetrapyrrole methylase family protein / MazG family protein